MKLNLKINKEKIHKAIKIIFLICWPILTIFLVHYIQYQYLKETLEWIFNNIGIVFLEYILLLGISSIFASISNRYSVGYFTTTIFTLLISAISHLKYEIRGEVLQIADITFLNNMGEVTEFVDFKMLFNWKLILPFIVSTIFGILQMKVLGKYRENLKRRGIILITAIMTLVLIFGTPFSQNNILPTFNLDVAVRYVPEVICEKNGIIMGLYINTLQNKVEIPDGYSEENVKNILGNIKMEEKELKEKPNIIVMMSESFFDPTVLPNITFSKDPIPNVRNLLSKYTSGNFVSSTFAGGTANIEFEVFTGNSIIFLPYGICPFSVLPDSFSGNIPTLQKDFKNNGYKTIAIHTYIEEFYNRSEVYPKLGFDEILFADDLEEVYYNGKYISDDTFVNEIIDKLETNEEPVFVYGLSMQNHTPYSMSNYPDASEIEITADLSEVAMDKLNAYVKGLHDTDKTIGRLIEYLEKSDKPTIFLFYGDHLPSLYEAYLESGFVSTNVSQDWNAEEMYKVHSIPFFIYDNFEHKQEYVHDCELGAPLLGNFLSDYVGINKSSYFHFLDTLSYRSIRDRLFVDNNGKISTKPYGKYLEEIEKYKILQYDILHGERYINN